MFVEVTGQKLLEGLFAPLVLNRVNEDPSKLFYYSLS